MKSRVFWISNLILLMSTAGVFLINSNYKTYVKAYIHDDKFLTIIGVIGGIGNGCSRFFWNLFFNKTGFKTVLLTIITLLMIVFATIRFTVTNQSAYLFEVFMINCCLGGFLVVTPTGLQTIYGHTTGSKIYAVYMVNFALANFIAWVYISQLSNVIGFNNVIYICLFMMGIAVPVVVLIKFQGPWDNDTSQLEFYVRYEIEKRENERVADQHSNYYKGD
jgi:predicted MFS family arabinose efflux permease